MTMSSTNSKNRRALPLLRALLIICILFVASRNFTLLHSLAAGSVNEQRDDVENERRRSFVVDRRDAAAAAAGSDGSKRHNAHAVNDNVGKLSSKRSSSSQHNIISTIPFQPAKVPSDPFSLPHALQPVTFQQCCPLLTRTPKKPKCGEVCLTEFACNNTLYPYTSVEEREFMKPMDVESKEVLRDQCNEMNGRMHPPYTWCRQWLTDSIGMIRQNDDNSNKSGYNDETTMSEHYEIDPYAANLPPPGCSIFNNGGGSGAYQHLMLLPEAKMAFCGIPKVGITQWLQFLRFTFGAKDYLSSPHIKGEVFAMRFDKMNEVAQREILNDPEWKFVAFLRDPAERLLSAYLDKVSSKKLEREHFQKQHGLNRTLDFDEFLNVLGEQPKSCPPRTGRELDRLKGVNWCTNPHWRPQTYSCGISEFLPRFSFVGSLNYIDSQARAILHNVGLWEKYGKYYHWHQDKESAKGASRCSLPPPVLKVGEELFGFQQKKKQSSRERSQQSLRASDTGYGHATDSKTKMSMYYTSPEMLEKVKRLYTEDYKLWDLVNEEQLHSGSELAMSLSVECRSNARD